jgi:alpha-L-rhamnosidase
LASSRRNQIQTAYRILVADSPETLAADQGNLWDSGCVPSGSTTHIAYAGKDLKSAQLCFWKVRVWDGNGSVSPWSEPAHWQVGLLDAEDWLGQWIGADLAPVSDLEMNPVIYARGRFKLDAPVRSATLFATAKGVYVASINGHRVGSAELTPGWTDYDTRFQVQAYEVTEMVREGANVLGASVADGWYSGYLGFKNIHRYYGAAPRVLLQLVVVYADGSTEVIATNETWQVAPGPIRYSDIQMGERYDARLEMPGWNTPGGERSGRDVDWQPAVAEPVSSDVILEGQRDPCIQVTEEIAPIAITEPKPGVHIFDLGQNFAGRVRLEVAGEAGTEIRLRYGEMLEPDGSLHTANLRSARATDTYTLRGGGMETYTPQFTYHGFRYVELTGYPGAPTLQTITGQVMHNALPQTGQFECSHPLINQLWQNILWGQRSNFISIPTDCPQRDERLGWSGDAQIFCRTASFNMDVAAFFTKWMIDYTDAQTDEGAFTDIAPQIEGMGWGAPAWGDAGIIIPWTMYRVYGDTQMIERHYEAMRAWMDYIADANPLFLRTKRLGANYSDWVALERGTSAEQISTAYWAKIARMMSEMAAAIGREADAKSYAALHNQVRQAYITAYVHATGAVETGTQAAYVAALDNGLIPEPTRQATAQRLVAAIAAHGGHLATGFLGTPPLCFVLSDTGHLDVAYDLLEEDTYPSWLYMIHNGATTMWERWNAYTHEDGIHDPGMNSFNHYAYGAIAEWLYRVVAGIDQGQPGYKHILLRPRPGGSLTHAKAHYDSIQGPISSEWRLDETTLSLNVTVPANTTATLEIPTTNPYTVLESGQAAAEAEGVEYVRYEHGVATFELGSGAYSFVADQN